MVISLARTLQKLGRRPAVVSRGYGRKDESEFVVVSDGTTVLADAAIGGDEPVLLGSCLPNVPVVVGSDRSQAAKAALSRFPADTVILDDGFQHIRLRRTLDIVLIDAMDPFGNEKLFPAGILREPLSALKRAHAVVLTRAGAAGQVQELETRIAAITAAPVFTSSPQPVGLAQTATREEMPLSALKGMRILAFSGIARPDQFFAMLAGLGADVAETITYPDHHAFTPSNLADVYTRSADRRVHMIVTTEKDAVRLKPFASEGVWALRIETVIAEQEEWERFLRNAL
jgi:tetraacyldisaccharide 4'-kinase